MPTMQRSLAVRTVLILTVLLMLFSLVPAQKKKKSKKVEKDTGGPAVMWQPVKVADRDLFLGPGGPEMRPDISSITIIEQEKQGASRKYRIKDGAGRTWVAKIGREAQPETAAVRLLYGI